MVGKQKRHDPSLYRALVREMKSGGGKRPGPLLDEARRISNPYYVSLALFDLSRDSRLELEEAASAAEEALITAGSVERLWQRAELLTIIAGKVGSWRGREAAKSRERLLDGILDSVLSMPEGKGLSDAILGTATHLGCSRMLPLLEKAVNNGGSIVTDAKAVIQKWAQHCEGTKPTLEDVSSALLAVDDGAVRSRLMGYLHLQCRRSKGHPRSLSTLRAAVEAAVSVEGEECLDVLRYLGGLSSTREEQEVVAGGILGLKDPGIRARVLATLGGSADKAGMKDVARGWFKDGLAESSKVEDSKNRASIRLNLARGLGRCGDIELAKKTYLTALEDSLDNEKLMSKINRIMEEQGLKSPKVRKSNATKPPETSEASQARGARNMLALYNTYKGGLKSVHLRAVARAAPLCVAFELDLALMGFPAGDLEALVRLVATDTNIGMGGKYLNGLVERNGVVLVPCIHGRLPTDWRALGLPVATTSHPREEKRVGMAEAISLARSKHPLGRVCLIMGLGKRGLSTSILDGVPYHLELTGKNVPLETCTAMGVIAQQLKSKEM